MIYLSDDDASQDDAEIIDLSDDEVSPIFMWTDDVDHYVEIKGLSLLLEHRICGAEGCLQITQLDYCTAHLFDMGICVMSSWLWSFRGEIIQERRDGGQVCGRAGQILRQRQIHAVAVRRQLSGLRNCAMRGGLRQHAAWTKQLQN
jgi:hypothetical protein